MLENDKIIFNEDRDRNFIIPESVESLYLTMYKKLYKKISTDGKLEFKRTKSKEEIISIISELLYLGKELNHNTEPSDKMLDYLNEKFDTECIVEFISRRRRTHLWGEKRHDPRYIEQDLPLADDDRIQKITKSVLEWGRDEISSEEEIVAK